MAEFIEIVSQEDVLEAFDVLKELDDRLDIDRFLSSRQHELSAHSKLFAVRHAGAVVSAAGVWLLMTGLFERIMWIHAFVTTKQHRSKGFGSLLLAGLYQVAANMGCSEVRVHAHRPKAIAFWKQKAGFSEFSTILRKNDVL